MQLYHAIIVCKRDEHLVGWHVENSNKVLGEIGGPFMRCLYYGIDPTGEPRTPSENYTSWQVPFLDTYENLPLKTYGMFRHALWIEGWTHLLKADVNSYPSVIDFGQVENHHLVGYRTTQRAGITAHEGRVYQKGLDEAYLGPMQFPNVWCGGPAYVISRELAEKVVKLGAWHARAWPYEDIMVSAVALDNGCPAVDGVGYWTDGHDYHH